jgi:hypothetical protein
MSHPINITLLGLFFGQNLEIPSIAGVFFLWLISGKCPVFLYGPGEFLKILGG